MENVWKDKFNCFSGRTGDPKVIAWNSSWSVAIARLCYRKEHLPRPKRVKFTPLFWFYAGHSDRIDLQVQKWVAVEESSIEVTNEFSGKNFTTCGQVLVNFTTFTTEISKSLLFHYFHYLLATMSMVLQSILELVCESKVDVGLYTTCL